VENLNPLHLLQRQSKEVFDTLIFVKKREIFWSKFCSIFSLFLYRRKIVSLSQSIETRYFRQAKKDNVLQNNKSASALQRTVQWVATHCLPAMGKGMLFAIGFYGTTILAVAINGRPISFLKIL
jgi:hypothetical protein